MKYNHLSQNERYQIFALMKAGLNQTQVALTLGRSKSTISREIERNSGLKGYRPKQATLKSEVRALGSRNAKKVSVDTLKSAFDLVRQEWSPEQIAGTMNISHETVYRHVYADKDCGGKLGHQGYPSSRKLLKMRQAVHPESTTINAESSAPFNHLCHNYLSGFNC